MLCDSFGSFAQLNCRPCRKQCGWQSVAGRTVFLFLLGTLNFSAIALLCCAPDSGNTNSGNNPGAPVAGANSFTEGQAKSRIESTGFSNVSELKKDDNGVWRGKAMKDGKSVDVSLDFQGNVVSR